MQTKSTLNAGKDLGQNLDQLPTGGAHREGPRNLLNRYEDLSGTNPLKYLPTGEQMLLVSLLKLMVSPNPPELQDQWKILWSIAQQAEELANNLELVRSGPLRAAVGEVILPFARLPELLQALAETTRSMTMLTAKRAGGDLNNPSSFLVMASELTHLATGSYNDEHLAELAQTFFMAGEGSDLSGDAIRTRRKRFKEDFRVRYEYCCDCVRVMTGRSK